MPIYKRSLEVTYYNKGFFNVTVDFDHYVRDEEGEITLELVGINKKIKGRIDRSSNQNGTARIRGGSELKQWFQRNFKVMDVVDVDLSSKDIIRLGKNL